MTNSGVLYLAVLPFYRQECIAELRRVTGDEFRIFAGSHHLDPTIRTGIDSSLYTHVRNLVFAHRVIVQLGHWGAALSARTTVVDLNPRSITAWVLLVCRRLVGRRTLVWGHLHPRSGGRSRTAILRRSMRRLANGTILYGFDSVKAAREEVPTSDIWVAPNSIYRSEQMGSDPEVASYTSILYVGRLVPEKKVDLLISAFAESRLYEDGVRLVVIGDGQARADLVALAERLAVSDYVDFPGHEARADVLRKTYSTAICSVSPGYVGLSLTQSLGFGVPMAVSQAEPHSPEIELARFGGVQFFRTDSSTALAGTLRSFPRTNDGEARQRRSSSVARSYSAESMAAGLVSAVRGELQALGEDGWPIDA